MATLSGKTIASTYTSLLKLEGDTGSTVAGASGNAVQIKTGDDDDTALYLNTDRVGILTAYPGAQLTVAAGTSGTSGGILQIGLDDATIDQGNVLGKLQFVGTEDDGANWYIGAEINATLPGDWSTASSDHPSNINFSTVKDGESTLTQRMTILGTGSVGIGTSSPISIFEIEDGTGTGGAILTLGTKETAVDAADVLGRINFYAPLETGTDAIAVAASISAVAQASFTASVNSTALYFQTGKSEDATGTTASMVIDEDGYVGIGTLVPAAQLTIAQGSTASTSGGILQIGLDDSGDDTIVGGNVLGQLQFVGREDGVWYSGATINCTTPGDWSTASGDHPGNLNFSTVADASATLTQRMTILGTGNVGIGTSTPAVQLDIENVTTNSTSQGGILRLGANDGTVMVATDRLGVIQFAGAEDTSNTMTVGARIEAVADATWSASENGASLDFYTTDGNAVETQRMTILATGNVGIGTDTPTVQLEVLNATTSSASQGGFLRISADDGAAMGSGHRLGVIEFAGAEDASSTMTGGASIQAVTDAGWSASENGTNLLFYTTDADASSGSRMIITATGNVFIGDDANAKTTLGLTINQGAADDEILALKSSDVAHGITDEAETDTYGSLQKGGAGDGGVLLSGFTEGVIGTAIWAKNTTEQTGKNTSSYGGVLIASSLKTGTAVGNHGSDANLMVIRQGGSTVRFIFDAEGSFHADVESTTYDSYNDAALVRAFDLSHGKDVIASKFDEFINYNHETLAKLKLVGREEDGTPNKFINVTKMQQLHNGAIWQQYTEMQKMKELMYDTMVELMGKERANKKLDEHDIKLLDKDLLN